MTDVQLPAFPMTRTCPHQPPEGYAALRENGPLAQVRLVGDRTAWVVTDHDVARTLLVDPRLSSDRLRPDFPVLVPRMSAAKLVPLVGMDPPVHTQRRRMLIAAFTVHRTQQMRPEIEEIVSARLDAVLQEGPPVDLVPTLALPVPSTVICRLLGVPYADHDFFESQTQRMVLGSSTAQEAAGAAAALTEYVDTLIGEKQTKPGEGLLDELIASHLDTGQITRRDLAETVMFLLVAGHETTANMITMSIVGLLENPEQLDRLRSDWSLLPNAVEELLRYLSVADEIQRVVAEPIEVAGHVLRVGDAVYLPAAASNRDPAAFPDPDALDVSRRARHHLAFGYGIHQCLGQNLARAELEVTLRALFERLPTLALAEPLSSLPVKPGGSVQGVYRLPVTW
ncbi:MULTISPECIES: cytochrome P450 [Micromonospora]|uniref:Cytochrome P450 n=4 Tax=Micromonospora TaxID=1873 RepID=F4F7G4_MICM1|nr:MULTISPECIES: cytochrome P450 [Micromonospora]AIS85755.1 cytochrome P450 [Verrucosispora sp. MS100047]AEB44403.1 cytochrome P450 [Micromonospora maris AB-18-032]AEK75493.1 cytochrome P450 [Micromonospora maris AB-18-032]KUJ43929.1 cytochrome [Micromonospora maris]RUL90223.1 cytochrome P450 [Verrucosispora sp. FIM060022]